MEERIILLVMALSEGIHDTLVIDIVGWEKIPYL